MTPAAARNRAEAGKRGMINAKRRRAVRDVLAGGYTPSKEEVGGAAARVSSRQALDLARASFDSAIGDNAEKLAGRLVELALQGEVSCLLTVARSIVPPAKYDSTKIKLDVGAIETLADVDAARRKAAAAVFAGEV